MVYKEVAPQEILFLNSLTCKCVDRLVACPVGRHVSTISEFYSLKRFVEITFPFVINFKLVVSPPPLPPLSPLPPPLVNVDSLMM